MVATKSHPPRGAALTAQSPNGVLGHGRMYNGRMYNMRSPNKLSTTTQPKSKQTNSHIQTMPAHPALVFLYGFPEKGNSQSSQFLATMPAFTSEESLSIDFAQIEKNLEFWNFSAAKCSHTKIKCRTNNGNSSDATKTQTPHT